MLSPECPPHSVLILKPSSLGDVVHTLPAVAALKRLWPRSCFRWLVNPEWAPLLHGNPGVEEIHLFPRNSFRGSLAPLKLLAWARQFARVGASDLVLDFQGLLRSALVGKLCRKRDFYGLSDAREGARYFYDNTVSVARGQHAVDRYLSLASALGASIEPALEWPLPSADLPIGFSLGEPYVVLHPFSRGHGKSLSLDDLAALSRSLSPLRVVLVGRAEHTPPTSPHVENWLNRTSLRELCGVLRHAAWVVSVDSGPMHIAAALHSRLVAIHTWSDPQRVGPYDPLAWVWQQGQSVLFQRGTPAKSQPVSGAEALGAWVKARVVTLQGFTESNSGDVTKHRLI